MTRKVILKDIYWNKNAHAPIRKPTHGVHMAPKVVSIYIILCRICIEPINERKWTPTKEKHPQNQACQSLQTTGSWVFPASCNKVQWSIKSTFSVHVLPEGEKKTWHHCCLCSTCTLHHHPPMGEAMSASKHLLRWLVQQEQAMISVHDSSGLSITNETLLTN